MYRSRAFVTLIIALTAIVLSDISLNEEKKSMESIKKLKKKILSTMKQVSAIFLLAAGKKATDDNVYSYGWYTKYYRLMIKQKTF